MPYPELQGTDPGDFPGYAETVGDQGRQHVNRVVVGHGNQQIHRFGIRFLPAVDAHGSALNQSCVHLSVCIAEQIDVRLDSGHGVTFMHQSFGQVEADAAQSQNEDIFKTIFFLFKHAGPSNPSFLDRNIKSYPLKQLWFLCQVLISVRDHYRHYFPIANCYFYEKSSSIR